MKLVRASIPILLVALVLGACGSLAPKPAPRPSPVYSPTVDATGATDVSAPMAAFLAAVPDGATINLRSGGRYRMEKTFNIYKRRNLTINGNGATFFATTIGKEVDAARLRTRSNVNVLSSVNIVIRNLKVVGANPKAGTHDDSYVPGLEAQHGFNIFSSQAVFLIGCSATDTYGDFIYMGGLPPADHVLISGFKGLRSGRQGIAIASARNVIVENSALDEVRRSTIDFEPQGVQARVENVTIRNNTVYGGRLNFVAAHGNNPVDHITIQGNKLTRHVLGITVNDLGGGIRRDWKVLNNVGDIDPVDLHGAGNPGRSAMDFTRVDGLVVRGNTQLMRLGEAKGGPVPYMYGVKAIDSKNVVVSGNNFPRSVGQLWSITSK